MLYKLSILFLLLSINSLAQTSHVKVQYSLKIGYDEGFSNADALKDYYAMAQKGADQIHFDLEASKTASFFKQIEFINNAETNFASAFAESSTSYYTEANSNSKNKYTNDIFGKFQIIYEEKTTWKLENETKYIDNYLCYKAIAEQIIVNSEGTFKHPIVAWYCPSIPFSFGPRGFNGLPGLILELQVRNITWGAQKIELSNEEKIIEKPTKGKLITLEEYNKLISTPPSFAR